MLIEDGKGTGYRAKVNSENCLCTEAVCIDTNMHVNQVHGRTYSLIIEQTPTGAGDCFCYIKNDDEKDMVISSIKVYTATDETVEINLGNSGTPIGGSANSPVNRNAGSGNLADATCLTGNDITGLSGGKQVELLFVKGGFPSERYGWVSGIILPKNHTLTLYVGTGGIALKATMTLNFNDC